MALEKGARHLSKHIFARQYGLPTVFTSEAYRMGARYVAREADIKVWFLIRQVNTVDETLCRKRI